jgi:hypothetical protein
LGLLFRPEENFSQTVSVADPRLDRSRTIAHGNPVWRHVLAPPVMNGQGCHPVHHPKCVRPQSFPSPRGPNLEIAPVVTSRCTRFMGNIILEWLIALCAHASHVPNVGLGLCFERSPKVGRRRKGRGPAAPTRSVERNSISSWVRRGFLKCLCLFSSGATSTALSYAKSLRTTRERSGMAAEFSARLFHRGSPGFGEVSLGAGGRRHPQ